MIEIEKEIQPSNPCLFQKTIKETVAYLTKEYQTKTTGNPFTVGDVAQWADRGRIATEYGGLYIKKIRLGRAILLEFYANNPHPGRPGKWRSTAKPKVHEQL